MKEKKHFGVGSIILLIAVFLSITPSCSVKDKYSASSLPIFRAKDLDGQFINSASFKGKTTFISFVKPELKRDRDLFNALEYQFGNEIRLIAISKTWEKDNEWKRNRSRILISDPDGSLFRLFGASYEGINFIYDNVGKLLGAGSNQMGYEEGPKTILLQYLHGIRFDRKMMYPGIGGNISEDTWLKQLDSLRKANVSARYFIFGLFSSICDGCSSGGTIQMLKRISSATDERLSISIVLSPDFDETDILCLQTQLRLNIPSFCADKDLAERWTNFKNRYRPSDINEFVLLIDSFGKILLEYDRFAENSQDSLYNQCLAIISTKELFHEKS